MKLTPKTRLPKTLSGWLELAVQDAMKCEVDKNYKMDMQIWHGPLDSARNGPCHVCMAGAVIAKTCGAELNTDVLPDSFEGGDVEYGLHAIDKMRVGDFFRAHDAIDLHQELSHGQCAALEEIGELVLAGFDTRISRADWDTYLEAAKILKRHGL